MLERVAPVTASRLLLWYCRAFSESFSSAEAPTPKDSWFVAKSMEVMALSEKVTSMVNGAL